MDLKKIKWFKKMVSKFVSMLVSSLRALQKPFRKIKKANCKGVVDLAVKAVTVGGRIPLSVALMLILVAGAAFSLAEIYFYGKIETEIRVTQNILVDGFDNTQVITEIFNLSIGEAALSNHTIMNTADAVALVRILSYVTPENGVAVKYLRALSYSEHIATVPVSGSYQVDVSVSSGGEWVEWVFNFLSHNTTVVTGDGVFGAALVISLNSSTPSFRIHNNFGLCSAYPNGTWLYNPYDSNGEWHSEKEWNTPVDEIWWIEADGNMSYSKNPSGILTVRVNKAMLGERFGWAVYITTSGFTLGIPDSTSVYPVSFNWGSEIFNVAEIFEEIEQPIIVPPNSKVDFVIRYEANASGTYTVETVVVPA